VDLLDLNTIN